MTEYRHTLLRFLPAGAAKLRKRDGEQNADKSVSMHGFASSEMVALEDATLQRCWTGARKDRIRMLGLVISSILNPPKEVAGGGFEVGMKRGEIPGLFQVTVSYCCYIREAEDTSAA